METSYVLLIVMAAISGGFSAWSINKKIKAIEEKIEHLKLLKKAYGSGGEG